MFYRNLCVQRKWKCDKQQFRFAVENKDFDQLASSIATIQHVLDYAKNLEQIV